MEGQSSWLVNLPVNEFEIEVNTREGGRSYGMKM